VVAENRAQEDNSISDPPEVEVVHASNMDVGLTEYEHAQLPSPPRWADLRYEPSDNLMGLVIRIAEIEGPVHEDVVIERIRRCYRLDRASESVRARIEAAIRFAQRAGFVRSDGAFIWLQDDQLDREPRRPVHQNIEHVPPTELKKVVLGTARAMFGASRSNLVVETARKLGFSRTGGRIALVLNEFVQALLDEGQLKESFGMVRPAS
jgi:hypothetical protein